jgi:dCMP deaminase
MLQNQMLAHKPQLQTEGLSMTFRLDPESPPNDDDYYMGVALAVRRKANCTGNRVAAVIVRDKRVIATGYNGVPEGMTNCLDGGCLRCKPGKFKSGKAYDLCICVHAEQNALLSAARFGIAVEGAYMYTTMQPCFGCAKELVQAKIAKVFYLHSWVPGDPDDPIMDAAMKAEYAKIIAKTDMKQIRYNDPVDVWAVTALRKGAPLVLPVLDSADVSSREKAAKKQVLMPGSVKKKRLAVATRPSAQKKRVA